jgi:hypothetical protein
VIYNITQQVKTKKRERGKEMIKQTQLSFKLGMTEDEITPRSGLSVYAEFLRGFGIKDFIDKHMPLPESNRGYKAWQYLEPLMLMLYGGGRHIEDLREIAEDKALRKVIGLNTVPSSSTVGDWLRRMGKGDGIESFKQVIEKTIKRSLTLDSTKEYTLWSDPTIIEAEKQEAKMTYQGVKGYRPIMTAFKELPVIVYHQFREGNCVGGVKEALEKAYSVLPSGKKIRHASLDSEFYTAEVINLLRGRGTTFTIAADQDVAVKELILGLRDWRPFRLEDGTETDREVAETVHLMQKTKEAFRLIVLRWKSKQRDLFNTEEYRYHAIATDLECTAEEAVWEYHDRGQMENIIKELKIGIGMESLPSGDFGANSFWFSIGVQVYNTVVLQKILLLPESYKTKTIQTLRWSLVEIAGKIIKHGRRLWLLLATTVDKYRVYVEMRKRCMAFT